MKKHKTAAEVLACAKRLIAKGWCQHRYAVNSKGREVDPQDESAAKFCMLGALEHCEPWGTNLFSAARGSLHQVTDGPARFNDEPGRKKKDVLAKYDEAIKLAKRVRV